MTTICELKVGERAKVRGYTDAGAGLRRRLLSMGLTIGAEFSLVRVAPLGDPMEIEVRSTRLSLRKAEAEMLKVEKLI